MCNLSNFNIIMEELDLILESVKQAVDKSRKVQKKDKEFENENVIAFHEKPDLDTAKVYLENGNYFWNSGLFCFKSKIMKINTAEFVISNSEVSKCPKEPLPEYAFIGRSNVGKSSLINMICGKDELALTSGKPGKTRMLNYFHINNKWFLVDLPGYGYAITSKAMRKEWEKMIRTYLSKRDNLYCTFVDFGICRSY